MNGNALAKHYDKLTPRERFALIHAAASRGDELEGERLSKSAPRVDWSMPDYFGPTLAFLEVNHLTFMEVLDAAGWCLQTATLADSWEGEQAKRMERIAGAYGFIFKVKLAGWRLYCRESNLDPELFWSMLPGYATVKRAEEVAELKAFDAAGVATDLARAGQSVGELLTAEAVATDCRKCFEARAQWWG